MVDVRLQIGFRLPLDIGSLRQLELLLQWLVEE
jgi:hypothetical protein